MPQWDFDAKTGLIVRGERDDPVEQPDMTGEDLALYADPSYWLYGLLSFCAKICEAKTTEVGGQPNFKTSKERKKEGTAPVLEPTRNSLPLCRQSLCHSREAYTWARQNFR